MSGNASDPVVGKKELRGFGLVFAAGITLIFGLFIPWLVDKPWPLWPWIVAAISGGTGLLLPQLLKPVYHVWMKIGHVLGWINTRIILGAVFFVMFAPIALVLRLLGKDFMRRRMEPSATTYREESEKLPRDRLEKPY